MSEIKEWKEQINNDVALLTELNQQLTNQLDVLLGNFNADNYDKVTNEFKSCNIVLEQLLMSYHTRSILLSKYFDKANKLSTLVLDNYDKMEECLELTKNEIKELVKKVCSFSTLEMDYYEKLLNGWKQSKDNEQDFKNNYEHYKHALNRVHRLDQIQIYKISLTDVIVSLIQVLNKFISVLNNKDNINEICKLWEETPRNALY